MASSDMRPDFGPNAATILATEHWSVLGTRSMTWTEASARTGVFLTVLSAAAVALALVADATEFGDGFALFALVLFPIVLFLGGATYVRLVQINVQDAFFVIAMNRLRHAYLEIAPDLAPYFTTASHDDFAGIVQSFTYGETLTFRPWVQFLVTTPTVVASINSTILAAGVALIASRSGVTGGAVIVVAAVAFVVAWLAQFALQVGRVQHFRRSYIPRFPSS